MEVIWCTRRRESETETERVMRLRLGLDACRCSGSGSGQLVFKLGLEAGAWAPANVGPGRGVLASTPARS